MRRPSEVPGGLPGLVRWATGGVFRVAGRAFDAVRHRATRWWEPRRVSFAARREDRRWKRQVRRGARGRFRMDVALGTVSNADIPIIVCLWNRPTRIDAILTMLDSQSTEHGLRLMLWNNNPEDDAHYRERIASFRASGSLRSVEYHSSRTNLGGFARFFLARRARAEGTESRALHRRRRRPGRLPLIRRGSAPQRPPAHLRRHLGVALPRLALESASGGAGRQCRLCRHGRLGVRSLDRRRRRVLHRAAASVLLPRGPMAERLREDARLVARQDRHTGGVRDARDESVPRARRTEGRIPRPT